jgi:hypothetical protein
MSDYKYLKEFYKSALIDPEKIILEEVDIAKDFVCIYIVTRNKNMFDVYTAVGSIDKPIKDKSINHVLLFEKRLNKLFEQIK